MTGLSCHSGGRANWQQSTALLKKEQVRKYTQSVTMLALSLSFHYFENKNTKKYVSDLERAGFFAAINI
jgi:hypothetical protein